MDYCLYYAGTPENATNQKLASDVRKEPSHGSGMALFTYHARHLFFAGNGYGFLPCVTHPMVHHMVVLDFWAGLALLAVLDLLVFCSYRVPPLNMLNHSF